MSHPACIYFVRAVGSGLIKIGITTNMHQRFASLARHNKDEIEPLYTFRGDEVMEARLHRRFRRHLARGREWFWPDPDLLDFIRWVRRWGWVRGDRFKRAIMEGHFGRLRA